MPKTTAFERAVQDIDYQIRVLELAREHILAQQQPKKPATKKPRAVPSEITKSA